MITSDKRQRTCTVWLLLASTVALLVACGGGGGGSSSTSVAPSITAQPASESVGTGTSATLSVSATGTPAPTYQWQISTDGGTTFSSINGATASVYTTPATAAADNGHKFRVVVTNSAGSITSSAVTLTVTATATSIFSDALVKGLCYSAAPSGTTGTTDASGAYNFVGGDVVTFWIDLSGGGCGTTVPSAGSTTAILLGPLSPTGTQTFVLALTDGAWVAQILQALNHGTASAMDVSGITVLPANASAVTNVNSYLANEGTLPGGVGSIDQLFYQLQQASLVGGAPLVPVLAATNVVVANSPFAQAVNNNLNATLSSGALGPPPSTVGIPATGEIIFNNSAGVNGATAATENTPYVSYGFIYRDGQGSGLRLAWNGPNPPQTPGQTVPTYTVSGNVQSSVWTLANGGKQYTTSTVAYNNNGIRFDFGTYTQVNTSNVTYLYGSFSGSWTTLTPLTLPMLAGHILTLEFSNPTCTGIFTFNSNGSSAVASGTCGDTATYSVQQSPISGVPIFSAVSNGVGHTAYFGLSGASLTAPGAVFVVVDEELGGNGNPASTAVFTLPIISFQ
jgi:hypothetical protein